MSLPENLPFEFVDIRGKKTVKCPHCGSEQPIPPREISLEKLKQMAWAKKLGEMTNRDEGDRGFSNVRATLCSNCGQPIMCIDEFSTIHKGGEISE